jgi:tRNA A-37 threonylcarbamoyl transferase component Bud32
MVKCRIEYRRVIPIIMLTELSSVKQAILIGKKVGWLRLETIDPVEYVLNHLQERVFKVTYNGHDCFVKLNTKSKRNNFHQLQRLIFALTRKPLFAPTVIADEKNIIVYEAEKLNALKQLGLHVPRVYSYSDRYMIIEDCGRNLSEMLKVEPAKTQYYLEAAIRELAKLHKNGRCHGGAQIRNFTVKEDQIYLIDFEEEDKSEYFEGLFLRDLIIFLESVIDNRIENFSITDLIAVYEQSSHISVRERLFHLAQKGQILELFIKKPFSKYCGHDLVVVNRLLEQIREGFNPKNNKLRS